MAVAGNRSDRNSPRGRFVAEMISVAAMVTMTPLLPLFPAPTAQSACQRG